MYQVGKLAPAFKVAQHSRAPSMVEFILALFLFMMLGSPSSSWLARWL